MQQESINFKSLADIENYFKNTKLEFGNIEQIEALKLWEHGMKSKEVMSNVDDAERYSYLINGNNICLLCKRINE